jgi:hypothetical protein
MIAWNGSNMRIYIMALGPAPCGNPLLRKHAAIAPAIEITTTKKEQYSLRNKSISDL